MSALSAGNPWLVVLRAPAVALAYVTLAYAITRVGCMPPFSDARFFGAPVTFFLILALTASTLILIVFASAAAWRAFRVLRRRRRGQYLALAAGVLLAATAFAATLAALIYFLRTLCV